MHDDSGLAQTIDELALIAVGGVCGAVAAICLVLALGIGCAGVASSQANDVRDEAVHH